MPTTTLDPATGFPAGVPGDLPNGVYRVEISDADLDAVNMPAEDWPENHGKFTWTLKDGVWSDLQEAPNPLLNPTVAGVYIVEGDHVTFLVANDLGPQELTWKLAADGSLIFTALASTSTYFAAFLGSHPLVPVQ